MPCCNRHSSQRAHAAQSGLRGNPRLFRYVLSTCFLLVCCLLPAGAAISTNPVFHTSLKAAAEAAAADQSLVLLIFGADWCGPCKALKAKTLASREFAEQAGALHLVEIDVDTQPGLARDYEVQAVPTLVLMTPENKIVGRRSGFLETAQLLLWLREGLDRAKAGKWEGIAPGEKLAEFFAKADALETNDLARLVELLGERNPADRESAARLLSAQREQAVLPLIEAVTNSYLGVRIAASEVLHELAPEAAIVDPWQSPLELADTAAALRKWWTETGKLPVAAPAPSTDPANAVAIATALQNLRSDDPVVRTRAMSTLAGRGPAGLPEIRSALQLCDKSGDQRTLLLLEDVRWAILIPDTLEQRAPGARNLLARGKGPERQATAARLGRAGREAIPALAELVNDADPLVVENAVRALSSIGDKDAIPAMAALLRAADSNLRMTAAQALGRTKNSAAVKELLTVFDDPNEVVACTALSAFEEISAERGNSPSRKPQAPEVSSRFKKCLADPRWRVRAAAAEIAGKLDMKELTEDCKTLLDDADGFVVRNALQALRKFSASPDPEKLVRVADRHGGLRSEVVELLVRWGTQDAVKAVTDMYNAAGTEGRLAILGSLGVGGSPNQESAAWQPLLGQAAKEADPRLRRAAAKAMSAQPAKLAAALVGPLLSDEDSETRSAAAEVVLSVIGGERVIRAGSHGVSEVVFSESFETGLTSVRTPAARTNKPPATPQQIAGWHAALEPKLGTPPELMSAAAFFVTGDTNADLPIFQQALSAADKQALARLNQSAALAALVPRLPWPAAQPIAERFCDSPALFLHALNYVAKAAPGFADFLLQPGRFRAAVEPASIEDLAPTLPPLLSANQQRFSLLSGTPRVAALVTGLLEATNPVWRAAAVYCFSMKEDPSAGPVLERASGDSNGWVRASAILGLAKRALDRVTLEQRIGPFLADPDKEVSQRAAIALLEPETRVAAELGYTADTFQFQKIYAWAGGYNPSTEQRPLATLQTKPAFLEAARRRLQEASADDAPLPALLLAQYGDFSGLERLVAANGALQKESGTEAAMLAMVALSRDPKYLPFLKERVIATKEEQEFRRLLQALKGMTGPQARELRLEINKRMRQGSE